MWKTKRKASKMFHVKQYRRIRGESSFLSAFLVFLALKQFKMPNCAYFFAKSFAHVVRYLCMRKLAELSFLKLGFYKNRCFFSRNSCSVFFEIKNSGFSMLLTILEKCAAFLLLFERVIGEKIWIFEEIYKK